MDLQHQKEFGPGAQKKEPAQKINTKSWIKKKDDSGSKSVFTKSSKPLPKFNNKTPKVSQAELRKKKALAKGLFSGVEVQKKTKPKTKKAPVFKKPTGAGKKASPFSKPGQSQKGKAGKKQSPAP